MPITVCVSRISVGSKRRSHKRHAPCSSTHFSQEQICTSAQSFFSPASTIGQRHTWPRHWNYSQITRPLTIFSEMSVPKREYIMKRSRNGQPRSHSADEPKMRACWSKFLPLRDSMQLCEREQRENLKVSRRSAPGANTSPRRTMFLLTSGAEQLTRLSNGCQKWWRSRTGLRCNSG